MRDTSQEERPYTLGVYSPLFKLSGYRPRIKLSKAKLEMIHWCVLEHCVEAKHYIEKHEEKYSVEHPNKSKKQRVKHFIPYFSEWMDILYRDRSPWYSQELHSLGREPHAYACYSQCSVNGVRFVVHDKDENKRTQNSGVMVDDGILSYYGIINNIIELRYANGMPVVVFECTWYNTDPSDHDSTKRDYGLLSVDTSTSWFQNWPYCLATTARQVYYLEDLKADEPWKVVNIVSHRGVYSESSLAINDEEEDDNPYQEEIPSDLNYGDGDVGNQMPKARRKLYLDDDDDMSESEDSDNCTDSQFTSEDQGTDEECDEEDHEGQSDEEPEFEDTTEEDDA